MLLNNFKSKTKEVFQSIVIVKTGFQLSGSDRIGHGLALLFIRARAEEGVFLSKMIRDCFKTDPKEVEKFGSIPDRFFLTNECSEMFDHVM